MRLPTFQPQTSTSMQSAMTTPARVGEIKERKPVTKRLVATRPVQAELTLGNQKARAIGAAGAVVSDAANAYYEIKQADDEMSSKAASAEYRDVMSKWTVQRQIDSMEFNDDGTRKWETYEKDYQEESKRLRNDQAGRYGFTTPRARQAYALDTQGTDSSAGETLLVAGNKSRLQRTDARYQQALAGANTPTAAKQLIEEAVTAGVRSQVGAYTDMTAWSTAWAYKSADRLITTTQAPDKLLAIQTAAANREGDYAAMTDTQLGQVQAAAEGKIIAWHLQNMQDSYERGGLAGALAYTKNTRAADPRANFMLEDQMELSTKLVTEFNRIVKLDKAATAGQADTDWGNLLFSQVSDEKAVATYVELDTADKKKINQNIQPVVAQMSGEDFYDNDTRESQIPLANMAKIGFLPEAVQRRLERDMNGPDALRAAGMVTALDREYPTAAGDIPTSSLLKAQYLLDRERNGQPLGLALEDWDELRTKTPDDAKQAYSESTQLLSDTTIDDRVQTLAEEHGVTGTYFGFLSESPEASDGFNRMFAENFHHFYSLTRSDGAANSMAFAVTRRVFGATERYGDTIWEKQPPESVLKIPNHIQGTPNDWINTQFDDGLAEINAIRKANKDEMLDADEIRLEKVQGQDAWFVTTLTGDFIRDPDGDKYGMEFLTAEPEKVSEQKLGLHNANAKMYSGRQASILAKSGLVLPKTTERVGPFELASDSTKWNRQHWSKLPDKLREASNVEYQGVFNILKSINTFEGVPEVQVDLEIHTFLNSLGYLHGDENDEFIAPPEPR